MLLIAVLSGPALAEPAVTVTPLASPSTTAGGAPILLPQGPAQALVSEVEIAPGAQLPVHRHPFQRMAHVLSGTLTVTDIATGVETTYDEGDFVVEVVDAWHFGRNDGTEPVRLLVIDLVPAGQSNTVLQTP